MTGRRVLVVLHDELLNGATIAVLRTVPMLEERGWEFAFWVPAPGPAFDLLSDRGHRVDGCPRPIASGLAGLRQPPGLVSRLRASGPYLKRLRRFARSIEPDVVHSNSLYSFAEAIACRRLGLPTALHLHDMAPASRKAGIARTVARRAPHVCFAVSRACARSYAHGGWEPRVVYGAGPVPDEPAEIRANPRPFAVGTVGVVARRKGSDIFVEAAERLAATGDIKFQMIGAATDPLDREWAAGVLDHAGQVGVEHIERTDVEAAMRTWDAFVLPSRRDPFPLAMLEAMALGLPVVGADVDGIPEQLAAGSGLLVPSEDPNGLAQAIRSLVTAPKSHRAELGRAARERVRREFNLERLVTGTETVYRDAIAAA